MIIRINFKNVDLILFLYKESYTNIKTLNFRKFTEEDYKIIGESFSKSAKEHNLIVHTCFEDGNLVEYGFEKGECLSYELAFKLTGKIFKEEWKVRKEKLCHCVQMVDIGDYN